MIRCFVGFHRKQWSFRRVTLILRGKVIEAVFNHRIIEKKHRKIQNGRDLPLSMESQGLLAAFGAGLPTGSHEDHSSRAFLAELLPGCSVPRCFCCKGFSSPWAGFGICPCWSLKGYVFSNAYDWPSPAG